MRHLAKAILEIFDKDALERIHEKSIEILDKVGIVIESKPVLEMVKQHVSRVDTSKMRAWFSESELMEWVRKAPNEITLCSRDGKRDLPHPSKVSYASTDGQPVEVFDIETGVRRYSTYNDCVQLAKLGDALPQIDLYWPMVAATDKDPAVCSYYEFVASLENTTKHVQHGAHGTEEAEFQIEYAAAIVGGRDKLERRAIISNSHTPVSPLIQEKAQIDGAVAYARANLPNIHLIMIILGSSGPVTIPGAIAQGNAEILSAIAICEMARPGSPQLYSFEAGAMDMRSGVFLSGSVEGAIMTAAACQLSRMYRLPNQMGGFAASGAVPGYEVGIQKAISGLIPVMAGADCVVGIGGINRSGVESAVQMVLDCEAWRSILKTVEDIVLDENTFAMKAIEEVGPGGTYLRNIHTLKNFKKEIVIPELVSGHSEKANLGTEEEMLINAKKKAKKILAEHKSPGFEPELKKELDAIFKRHTEKQLKGKR
ncbi:MAG: trimethylamine methyltransferase family protein [Thermoplasmata archaeon]